MTAYAELHCLSDFSFHCGASSALELFERTKACGYTALAITDESSLAGLVRAHEAAKRTEIHLIMGTEVSRVAGIAGLAGLPENIRAWATATEIQPDALLGCLAALETRSPEEIAQELLR